MALTVGSRLGHFDGERLDTWLNDAVLIRTTQVDQWPEVDMGGAMTSTLGCGR